MPTKLTSTGIEINGVSQSTPAGSFTYSFSEYATRTAIGTQSGGSFATMWNPIAFTKKTSSSKILVQGMCIGMDAYSYPYGATAIRLRHSDGTDYRKFIGSQYTHNGDGAQTVIWKVNCVWTGTELGSKTGVFNIYWDYGDASGSGGNKPWETYWNWNASDDGRARQQGSTTTVMEVI